MPKEQMPSLKERFMNLLTKKGATTSTEHDTHEFPNLNLSDALHQAHIKYNNPERVGAKDDFIHQHLKYSADIELTPNLRGNENIQLLTITRAYHDAVEKLKSAEEESLTWDQVARDVHSAFITLKVAYEEMGVEGAKRSLEKMEPPALPESAHLVSKDKGPKI